MPFFDQNHGLTPLQNMQYCDYLRCRLQTILFYLKDRPLLFKEHFCPKPDTEKILFIDHNHGLTSFEIPQNDDCVKYLFLGYKRFFSVEKIPKNLFKMIFAKKQKLKKVLFFYHIHGLTPLENMQKCDYLKCLSL